METVELKKLWNTLTENKLIDHDIAQENILEIITRKGNGILNRMKKRFDFDYYILLFVVIFLPLSISFVAYWNNTHPDLHTATQMGRTYTVLAFIEAFLVFALIDAIKIRKFLGITFNTGSVKESMEKVRCYLKDYLKKAKIVGLGAMYPILTFVLIDVFLKIDGFDNLNFSYRGSYIFESYFAVFVVLLMFALPSILKFQLKRFNKLLKDIDETLLELKEED